MDQALMSKVYKALSDQTRLSILILIGQGQKCGCDLIQNLSVTQPTLSHHLKVLSETALIIGVKSQNKVHYTVNEALIKEVNETLFYLINKKPNC